MKKTLLNKAMALFAGLFTFFALATSASACVWCYYQPEEPKALREE
ncbi:cyclic lactone autoinducer peptide [Clostridium lundense]|nr:cyclic lactone autoinducer peptide [Clostridium lundense]